MSKCEWCSKPSELAYHEECWVLSRQAASRQDEQRNREAHRLIKEIREGGNPTIPDSLLGEYGQYFEGARAARKKGRGGRNTDGV